jgi:hypothetical protein
MVLAFKVFQNLGPIVGKRSSGKYLIIRTYKINKMQVDSFYPGQSAIGL